MKHRLLTALLFLLAAGCASSPRSKATLVAIPPPTQSIDILLADLQSFSAATRAAAAWQLAGAVPRDQVLTAALHVAYLDPDETVREAAAWALAHPALSEPRLYAEPPRLEHQTQARYPEDAFTEKIQGTVLIEFLISTTGKVVHAEVRRSVPALDAAALECVKQWLFEPARLNGKPVPVVAQAPMTLRIR